MKGLPGKFNALLRRSTLGLFFTMMVCVCFSQEPAEGLVFNIKNYGAKGDGASLDTRAINRAIAACVKAGGGTVYVPAGTFVTGTFQLFSHVNLYLSAGAVLLASGDSDDYLLQKDYGFTGYGAGNKLGMIFADHAENVSITGFGAIDGRPEASLYMDSLQESSQEDWKYTRQGQNYMMSSGGSPRPAYDRQEAPVMWRGLYADRPGVEVLFSSCKRTTIKDITIRNAADWSMNLLACDDAKVLGISIQNNMSVPNSDGIDMYDSHNVVIADCDIRAGDDAIAVISTSNLTVTNCNLSSRSSGIRVGYNGFNDDNSGNLLFDNIRIYGSNRGIGIFQRRKGNMKNMLFSNMIIDTRLYPGQWWGHGEPIHISALPGIGSKEVGTISHVRFENIIARGEEGIVVYGSPQSTLQDIHFDNVQLTVTRGPLTDAEAGNFDLRATNDPARGVFKHDIPALYAQYVSGLTIKNLDVRWEAGLPGFFTNVIDCNHFQGLTVECLTGALAPNADPAMALITLRQGSEVRIRDTRPTNPPAKIWSGENVTGLDVVPVP
jgi:polygalacturonase